MYIVNQAPMDILLNRFKTTVALRYVHIAVEYSGNRKMERISICIHKYDTEARPGSWARRAVHTVYIVY